MPHRKLLTHEDDLFGRVALYNNLVSLDDVVECARVISTEITAERPRRSLANVMIDRGHLTTKQAGAIQAALRKRAAEGGRASAAPAGPTPKPKPLETRAPSGTSQVLVAIRDEDKEPGPQSASADLDRLKKIVKRIAPGRIYPEMLDYITMHRVGIVSPKRLAAAIEEPLDQVLAALKRWRRIGLLREEAQYPYCFGPTDEVSEEIKVFLRAWHEGATHATILGFILACE